MDYIGRCFDRAAEHLAETRTGSVISFLELLVIWGALFPVLPPQTQAGIKTPAEMVALASAVDFGVRAYRGEGVVEGFFRSLRDYVRR